LRTIPKSVITLIAVALLLVGLWSSRGQWNAGGPPRQNNSGAVDPDTGPGPEFERGDGPQPEQAEKVYRVDDIVLRDLEGRVVFRGTIDLTNTIRRIDRGKRLSFPNDGSVFQNRERRLPKKPSGYYREFVHPTDGLSGPGPQRVVVGQESETYYTPDHYQTFHRVR
jgi:filamentous hemagglutinin